MSYDSAWLNCLPVHALVDGRRLPNGDQDAAAGSITALSTNTPALALAPSTAGTNSCASISVETAAGSTATSSRPFNLSLLYAPKPASPVLHVTTTKKDILVISWQLDDSTKETKIKSKAD